MQQATYVHLTLAQERALHMLVEGVTVGSLATLRGRAGSGKSLILKRLQEFKGGIVLSMRELAASEGEGREAAIEETFLQIVEQSLARNEVVMVDDLHLITEIVNACSYPLLLDAALTAVVGEASALRKKLVFALDGEAPWPIRRRAYDCTIDEVCN